LARPEKAVWLRMMMSVSLSAGAVHALPLHIYMSLVNPAQDVADMSDSKRQDPSS